jgi:hypothetical protein
MEAGSLKIASTIKRLSKLRELAFYPTGACGRWQWLGVIRQRGSCVV